MNGRAHVLGEKCPTKGSKGGDSQDLTNLSSKVAPNVESLPNLYVKIKRSTTHLWREKRFKPLKKKDQNCCGQNLSGLLSISREHEQVGKISLKLAEARETKERRVKTEGGNSGRCLKT